MRHEFVNPNLHVVWVHFPMALLIFGTLIELFSFLWRRSGFRAAGRWMILIGALLAVPTALTGAYALWDVATIGNEKNAGEVWANLASSAPLSANQWDYLEEHVKLQCIATGICLFVVVVWLACSDRGRRRLHIPLLILLLIGVGTVIAGSWHGGEAVYRFGTGVQTSSVGAGAVEKDSGEVDHRSDLEKKLEYYAPPLQTHVTLAGLTIAIALAALGLAIRRSHRTADEDVQSALSYPDVGVSHLSDEDVRVDTLRDSPGAVAIVTTPETIMPAGRFWLLATLLALITAVSGAWFLNIDSDSNWDVHALRRMVVGPDAASRRLPHVIGGVSIVVLSLILAILARAAPRRRFALFVFSVLLLTAIAWQAWIGILLMYDTPGGPLTRFNTAVAATGTSVHTGATTMPATLPTTLP